MELPVTRINPLEFVLPVGEHGIDVLVDHLVAGDARHHDVHEGDAADDNHTDAGGRLGQATHEQRSPDALPSVSLRGCFKAAERYRA